MRIVALLMHPDRAVAAVVDNQNDWVQAALEAVPSSLPFIWKSPSPASTEQSVTGRALSPQVLPGQTRRLALRSQHPLTRAI